MGDWMNECIIEDGAAYRALDADLQDIREAALRGLPRDYDFGEDE